MAARRPPNQTRIEQWLSPSARPSNDRNVHPLGNGLDLVVFPTGPGRWRFRYRPRGTDPDTGGRFTQRSMAVGTTDTHTLKEARTDADALRLRVAHGEDPGRADQQAARAKRDAAAAAERAAKLAAAGRATCRDRLGDYATVLATRDLSAKHQREELAQARLALDSVTVGTGTLMDASPAEITREHVEKIIAICPAGSRALRFGAIDRFVRWAGRDTGAPPPTASFDRHEKPKLPPRRQRVLDTAELAAIWHAAGTLAQAAQRDLVRFMVSIPCREGEAAAMVWGDLDFAERAWNQPTSKNSLPHRFPLNDRAMAIVLARHAAVGGRPAPDALVFPSAGGKLFTTWSVLKRNLDRRLTPQLPGAQRVISVTEAPLAPWRFHDLRRTAATTLGEAGVDDALLDLILNHKAARTRGGVGGVYNTSQRGAERARALAAWDRHIAAALGEPTAGAEIVRHPAMREAVA